MGFKTMLVLTSNYMYQWALFAVKFAKISLFGQALQLG